MDQTGMITTGLVQSTRGDRFGKMMDQFRSTRTDLHLDEQLFFIFMNYYGNNISHQASFSRSNEALPKVHPTSARPVFPPPGNEICIEVHPAMSARHNIPHRAMKLTPRFL